MKHSNPIVQCTVNRTDHTRTQAHCPILDDNFISHTVNIGRTSTNLIRGKVVTRLVAQSATENQRIIPSPAVDIVSIAGFNNVISGIPSYGMFVDIAAINRKVFHKGGEYIAVIVVFYRNGVRALTRILFDDCSGPVFDSVPIVSLAAGEDATGAVDILQIIVTLSADKSVGTTPTIESIVAVPTIQRIVPVTAIKYVVSGIAGNRIV